MESLCRPAYGPVRSECSSCQLHRKHYTGQKNVPLTGCCSNVSIISSTKSTIGVIRVVDVSGSTDVEDVVEISALDVAAINDVSG